MFGIGEISTEMGLIIAAVLCAVMLSQARDNKGA